MLRDRMIVWLASLYIMVRNRRATVWFFTVHWRLPRLCPPRGFNDKLFWRKIVDRNPQFQIFNDKVGVRDWVSARSPDLNLPERPWQGTRPEDLPEEVLDRPVMIKASHGSGFNIYYDGASPSRAKIEETLHGWMRRTYGTKLAEWGYRGVRPVLFVEEMLGFADGHAPDNINVHAAFGEVLFASVYRGDKRGRREIGFFDGTGARLPLRMLDGADPLPMGWAPPNTLFDAMDRARHLSRDVDYVRCDFMATEEKIWFNEMTTYTASGHLRFDDAALVDRIMGQWDLSRSWFLSTPQTGWAETYRQALLRVLGRQ